MGPRGTHDWVRGQGVLPLLCETDASLFGERAEHPGVSNGYRACNGRLNATRDDNQATALINV